MVLLRLLDTLLPFHAPFRQRRACSVAARAAGGSWLLPLLLLLPLPLLLFLLLLLPLVLLSLLSLLLLSLLLLLWLLLLLLLPPCLLPEQELS